MDLKIDGITPFVTNNADFYRVDTAFVVPRVTTDEWQLHIHGLVDKEITLSYADLTAMPSIERMVTLTCVSNEVGGDLAGNAMWQGVRIADVLKSAGPQAGADCVLSTSVDGFTVTTPLEALTDDRDALFAFAMNGEPLPVEHGFPVRQVVPGLYGYVSATKWVVDLKVTTFADETAYWTSRGWSAQAPIKTASRIDVPEELRPGLQGHRGDRRNGLGPAPRDHRGAGSDRRRRVAGRHAVGRGQRRYLAPMGRTSGTPPRPDSTPSGAGRSTAAERYRPIRSRG